jgi:hypothetical protein
VTVANIIVFSLGFFAACLLGLIGCRLVWVRAVRLTRARLERDRPETLRAFEARIAGAQARAAISIRELERALERERQISAQARLMADQMSSSSALALAERDDTQTSLVHLSDSLNTTRERLREQEEQLVHRNNDLADLNRELADVRHELAMRDHDIKRITGEAEALRAELAMQLSGERDPSTIGQLAQSGDATAIARAQIESMREDIRSLRAEKNAAEASAARARLLLDAQDDNEAMAAAKAVFEGERDQLTTRITALEQQLAAAQQAAAKAGTRSGPQLVSDNGADAQNLATPLSGAMAQSTTDPDMLRASIDAMTASLAASAAKSEGSERLNALLNEAEESGADSSLVTSLVEARDRLRKSSGNTAKSRPNSKAKSAKANDAKADDAKAKPRGTRIAAATASGTLVEKASGMPKASESDLKVV